jgi:hypothetical protein
MKPDQIASVANKASQPARREGAATSCNDSDMLSAVIVGKVEDQIVYIRRALRRDEKQDATADYRIADVGATPESPGRRPAIRYGEESVFCSTAL